VWAHHSAGTPCRRSSTRRRALFLRVDADDRLALGQERGCRRVDVAELGVSVHVLAAFLLLRGALQAIAQPGEQLAYHRRRDGESLFIQGICKLVGGLGGPLQGRHGIAPRLWGDEVVELEQKVGVLVDQPWPSRSWTAHPIGGLSSLVDLAGTSLDGGTAHACRPGDCSDAAPPEGTCLRASQEPLLALVEMRGEPGKHLCQCALAHLHTTRLQRATNLLVDP
jgi:hypothetical protein